MAHFNEQGTLDIPKGTDSRELSVFPNPAQNTLNVITCDNTEIEIINIDGRVIYKTKVNRKNDPYYQLIFQGFQEAYIL